MGISIGVTIKQNSQNIPAYTSNITVDVTATWDNSSYNYNPCSGNVVIDGTTYFFTSPFNKNHTETGTVTLYSKTLDIPHNATGQKTVSVSATYEPGSTWGTRTASGSLALTSMPIRYTITVNSGTGAIVYVNRESSPSGLTGELGNGATVYSGDVLTITFSAVSVIYQIKTHTVNGDTFTSGDTLTVSGDVSIEATAKKRGVIHVDNGSEIISCLVWIDLGTEWKLALVYIEDGTAFHVCG